MDFPIYPPPAYLDPPFIRFSENFPTPYYSDPPFIKHQRVCYKVKCTYHKFYVTLRIFLAILFLYRESQPFSNLYLMFTYIKVFLLTIFLK